MVVATVAGALSIGMGTAEAAPSVLDAIAFCESSGNAQATNGSHFGLFQFDLATWRSVGGTGNPMNASVATQYALAQKLMAQRGTQPWNASKHCWQGKAKPVVITNEAKAPTVKAKAAPKAAPKPKAMKPKVTAAPRAKHAASGDYTVIAGDTLGKIAARQNVPGGWRALFQKNSDKVNNPHLIFPGQQLDL